MMPPRSDLCGVDAVRRRLALLTTLGAVLFGVSSGCGQTARDRFMHWFFEIPADAKEAAGAKPGPAAEVAVPDLPARPPLGPRFASVHVPFAQRRCDQCHSEGE